MILTVITFIITHLISLKIHNMYSKFYRDYVIIIVACLLMVAQACSKKSNNTAVIPDTTDTIIKLPITIVPKYKSTLTKEIAEQTNLFKTFQSDTLIQIALGLSETVITYINTVDKPMKVFILEVNLNYINLRIKAGTPNNRSAFSTQTVSEMARTQDTIGSRVLAAVNGDYFSWIAGLPYPQSVLYKNGIALKAEFCDLCTGLAIDDKNKASIVSKDRYMDPSRIREAVGGYHWLVKYSQKIPQGDLSIEPRTSVGVTTNNVVYIILADGRQATYSNGMSFSQLSDMYLALDVKDAINMDGGGSTTLVVKEGTGWAVKNKPSGGSQRAVGNSLTIVDVK